MYMQSELLFPHRGVADLKGLRDKEWDVLVERVASLPETDIDSLAFLLLIVRTCDCANCDMGSYKDSCFIASDHSINGQLMGQFEEARAEILAYLASTDSEDSEAPS
jgi:hypothetical protein